MLAHLRAAHEGTTWYHVSAGRLVRRHPALGSRHCPGAHQRLLIQRGETWLRGADVYCPCAMASMDLHKVLSACQYTRQACQTAVRQFASSLSNPIVLPVCVGINGLT